MADGTWTYSYGFYILLIIPIIPFIISAVLTGVALGWSTYLKRQDVCGIHMGFMCVNSELAFAYMRSCVKASVPFLGIVYNNVCLKVFSTFSCQQLRNGDWVLAAAPSIGCYDSAEHRVLMALSILALIIYVIGVPAFTLGSVIYAHHKDLLRDPKWLTTFGFFYTWFSKSTGVSIVILA
jgi:hypothetical protein